MFVFSLDVGRKAAFGIRAMTRLQSLPHLDHDTGAQMREEIVKYKEESAEVCLDCFVVKLLFSRD